MSSAKFLLATALLMSSWWAHAAEKSQKPSDLSCEPSRECAWELAKQAGRDNARAKKETYEYFSALQVVAHLQTRAGDLAAARVTLEELERIKHTRAIEPSSRSLLSKLQAAARLDEEALKTIAALRDPASRDSARRGVVRVWADQGRFAQAFDLIARIGDDLNRELARAAVVDAAVKSGRADWIAEVARRVDPAIEPTMWVRVYIDRREFAKAREATLKLTDAVAKTTYLGMIAGEIERSDDLGELAQTVRLYVPHLGAVGSEASRQADYMQAIEWLIKARAFDDAMALLPKGDPDRVPRQRAVIAVHRALDGDIPGAERMLPSLEKSYHSSVNAAILTRRVLAGDQTFAQAMAASSGHGLGLTSLERIGDGLPAARAPEARAALGEWARRCATMGPEDRDPSLAGVIDIQLKHAFFEDALNTARLMHSLEERMGALLDIGIAQAGAGDLAAARKTFAEAGSERRKPDFNVERHAQLAGALGTAGLLEEAYAETVALARRPASEYWYDADLDDVLLAHQKAGLATTAFELAALLSKHDRGNSHYYVVLASGVKTHP